jgi:hypothetical protein
MPRRIVKVTDHAVVRYLERVCGMDIESVRNAIAHTVQAAVDARAASVSVSGITYALDGAVVTTILDARSPEAARRGAQIANGKQVRLRPVGRE